MTIQKPRDSDVMGFLCESSLALAVREALAPGHRGLSVRFLVQRYHAERFHVKPDPGSEHLLLESKP